MITTGRPDSSATKTEVVDVVNGETCADLADFPLANHGAVGANLDGTLLYEEVMVLRDIQKNAIGLQIVCGK